jgi:hypothetical protein
MWHVAAAFDMWQGMLRASSSRAPTGLPHEAGMHDTHLAWPAERDALHRASSRAQRAHMDVLRVIGVGVRRKRVRADPLGPQFAHEQPGAAMAVGRNTGAEPRHATPRHACRCRFRRRCRRAKTHTHTHTHTQRHINTDRRTCVVCCTLQEAALLQLRTVACCTSVAALPRRHRPALAYPGRQRSAQALTAATAAAGQPARSRRPSQPRRLDAPRPRA